MGWGEIFMPVIAGLVLGWLAGLGIGGGTLLILWMTLVVGISTDTARAINLMFFIVCAGTVTLLRWKKGTIQLKKLLPAIAAGSLFAGIFAWVSTVTDVTAFRKLFGILLLVTGVRELFYRPRKAK